MPHKHLERHFFQPENRDYFALIYDIQSVLEYTQSFSKQTTQFLDFVRTLRAYGELQLIQENPDSYQKIKEKDGCLFFAYETLKQPALKYTKDFSPLHYDALIAMSHQIDDFIDTLKNRGLPHIEKHYPHEYEFIQSSPVIDEKILATLVQASTDALGEHCLNLQNQAFQLAKVRFPERFADTHPEDLLKKQFLVFLIDSLKFIAEKEDEMEREIYKFRTGSDPCMDGTTPDSLADAMKKIPQLHSIPDPFTVEFLAELARRDKNNG